MATTFIINPFVYQSLGYNSIANGRLVADAATVWNLGTAPPEGAIINIGHIVIIDGIIGGLPGQAQTYPYAINRTFNISNLGQLELGNTSANGGVGGYMPLWNLLKNSIVNAADGAGIGIQYTGDFREAFTQGTINTAGFLGITLLQDSQDVGIGKLNVTAASEIVVEGMYTSTTAKNASLLFSPVNVLENCIIATRPGTNTSNWKTKKTGYSDNFAVYSQYTSSYTSAVASISGNTINFSTAFTTGTSGQLVPGRYITITGSSTTANNVTRCIDTVISGTSVTVFGASLTTQGASGTAQITLTGNPNVITEVMFGAVNVASGKFLECNQYTPFTTSYRALTSSFLGRIVNNGTIKCRGVSSILRISDSACSSGANLGLLEFYDSAALHVQYSPVYALKTTKVSSYELDFSANETILTVTNLSNLTTTAINTNTVSTSLGTGTVDGSAITFASPVSINYPLEPGVLVRYGEAGVNYILSVSGDRQTITLDSSSGLTSASRTITIGFVEAPIILSDFADSCLLDGTAGYIKKIIPSQNKVIVTQSEIESSRTLSSAQGNVYVGTPSRMASIFTELFTSIKQNKFSTGKFIFNGTSSIVGSFYGNSTTQNFLGHWVFQGTSHNTWFGGWNARVVLNIVEFDNNAQLNLNGTNVGQPGDLQIAELRMTGAGRIGSIVNRNSGRVLYVNRVTGSGLLTFRPRHDAGTSTALNTISIDTNNVTFAGGVSIQRGVSTNQVCWSVGTGRTCTFQTLTIESTTIAAGTYATNNAALLSAFTGSGSVIVSS